MNENMISVTQFSNYVKQIFNAEELLHNIQIYGEVSGFNISRGTAYFSLKDEEALLPCVKFGIDESEQINEGDMVVVTGSPNYYIKGGRFSFVVSKIEPYGLGILYQKFIEMKYKLEKEGLFDEKRKKKIPKSIKRIGVVSSETGAVIQDIIDITRRRNPMLDIVLYPSKVQGIGAELSIKEGIEKLNETDVDVIVVARGGGSLEDLSPFNTELVARAIYNSNKPIISAVGHETDFTIADFVADLRAPTPSAAAELVSVDMSLLMDRFLFVLQKIENNYKALLVVQKDKLDNLIEDIFYKTENTLSQKYQPIKDILLKLVHKTQNFQTDKEQKLMLLTNKIELNNPLSIIKRGYATIENKDKRITSVAELKIGEDIKVSLKDGAFYAEIKSKEKKV